MTLHPLTFTVTEKQLLKIEKWRRQHQDCPSLDWWKFTVGSGIGVGLYLRCKCGEEKDFTDYEAW